MVIKEIEHFSKVFVQWFDFNYININRGKSLLLFSGKGNVINTIIPENKNELLDIILDPKLSIKQPL